MGSVGLALTLSACGSNDSNAPKAATFSSYSGTVVQQDTSSATTLKPKAWTGGAGTVKAYVGDTLLTSGALNANGSFTINLPAPAASELQQVSDSEFTDNSADSNYSCSNNTIKISNTAAKTAALELKAVTSSGQVTLHNAIGDVNNKVTVGVFIYADQAFTVTGTATCSNIEDNLSTTTITYNISLKQGWNKVSDSITIKVGNGKKTYTDSYTSGNLPTNNWYADLNSDSGSKANLGSGLSLGKLF